MGHYKATNGMKSPISVNNHFTYHIYSNVMSTFFCQITSRKLGCALDSIANLKNTKEQYIHLKFYDIKENIYLTTIYY
jgi:hypothetical protein